MAVELAAVALQLDDVWSAGRLIGLADATADRRDLPLVAPAERARAAAVRAAVANNGQSTAAVALGARSTLAEAASRLVGPVVSSSAGI